MRTIGIFMAVFLVTACMSEVKPYLKPVQVDIPNRIADQQKWLDQDVVAKTITREEAKTIRNKLVEIKENYDRLQSAGGISPKDSAEINRKLDQISEKIFELDQRKHKGVINY